MIAIELPHSLSLLLARIKDAGFLAYAVGGCVRDSLLGRPISDWDVTTSATPEQIKAIFADARTIDTGIKHGTVTVMLSGDSYEVTVFRVDGQYTDGRHPDAVRFSTSLTEDLARRDFTVNAMAYSPDEGIVDPFGGAEDIQNGVIRAVGEASQRFTEDALRILRAVRFASTLGFEIEKETAQAMVALSPRLSLVSAERVLAELSKTLVGKNAHHILSRFCEVIKEAWPCLSDHTAYEAGVALFPYLPADPDLRTAALFSHVKEAASPDLFLSLRFSRERADAISALCRELASPLPQNTYEGKCLLGQYGIDFCQKIAELWKAKCLLNGETPIQILEIMSRWQEWSNQNACVTVAALAISGKDVQAAGVEKGIVVGRWLRHLLEQVMQDRLPNDKAALLTYLREHLSATP